MNLIESMNKGFEKRYGLNRVKINSTTRKRMVNESMKDEDELALKFAQILNIDTQDRTAQQIWNIFDRKRSAYYSDEVTHQFIEQGDWKVPTPDGWLECAEKGAETLRGDFDVVECKKVRAYSYEVLYADGLRAVVTVDLSRWHSVPDGATVSVRFAPSSTQKKVNNITDKYKD